MDMNLKHHIRNNYQLGKMFYRQKVIPIYFKCAYAPGHRDVHRTNNQCIVSLHYIYMIYIPIFISAKKLGDVAYKIMLFLCIKNVYKISVKRPNNISNLSTMKIVLNSSNAYSRKISFN